MNIKENTLLSQAETLRSRGIQALNKNGKEQEALQILHEAMKLQPNLIGVNKAIGKIYYKFGHFYNAAYHFEQEYKIYLNNNMQIDTNLLQALAWSELSIGLPDKASSHLSQALNVDKFCSKLYEETLYMASHSFNCNENSMNIIAQNYYENCLKNQFSSDRDAIAKIREEVDYFKTNSKVNIGILLPAFTPSASSERLLIDLFENMNKNLFQIHYYYYGNCKYTALKVNDKEIEDFIASKSSNTSKFIYCLDDNPIAIAKKILENKIHISVDTRGHIPGNYLEVFTLKPAPVQISGFGYWGTTGLPEIDYRVISKNWLNENEKKSSIEKIIENSTYYYRPKHTEINIYDPPSLKNKYITFGCLNRQYKVNQKTIQIWAIILSLVTESKLILSFIGSLDSLYQELIYQVFEKQNIDRSRIIFNNYLGSKDYLEIYNNIDIALDPFPFSGGCTTADTLYMSTPIITLIGNKVSSRFTQSYLESISLVELIADSEQEYIFKAVNLAKSPERIIDYKKNIRKKFLDSKVMDINFCSEELQKILLKICNEKFPNLISTNHI